MGTTTQTWSVQVTIDEDENRTRARAVLDDEVGARAHGEGRARRHPLDTPIPEIGEELAVARAFYALGDRLMDDAFRDIANLARPAGTEPSGTGR